MQLSESFKACSYPLPFLKVVCIVCICEGVKVAVDVVKWLDGCDYVAVSRTQQDRSVEHYSVEIAIQHEAYSAAGQVPELYSSRTTI